MLYWRKRGKRMKDGKHCILIADDEKEIREILRLLLEGEGYAVLTAADGAEAQGQLRQKRGFPLRI